MWFWWLGIDVDFIDFFGFELSVEIDLEIGLTNGWEFMRQAGGRQLLNVNEFDWEFHLFN